MKILIAEDDLVVQRLLESLLSKWGYQVVVASDGQTASVILQSEGAPRLALLDWMMPGMDGLEVCRSLRRASLDGYTYVLLLTSRDGQNDILQGLDSGADDYLTKPVNSQELRARLRTGKRILELEDRLRGARERLRFEAMHDSLTDLWNHAAILDRLNKELDRARREETSLGVLLLDADHFKRVNDAHGHQAGDQVLREIANRTLSSVRSYDVVGRYGGEEFLILLPGCGDADARRRADQIRMAIASHPVEASDGDLAVTVSIGVAASASWPEADATALLRMTDTALYAAKDAGRNRVALASPTSAACKSAEGMPATAKSQKLAD